MNYAELTPGSLSEYHGYMDPNASEGQLQEGATGYESSEGGPSWSAAARKKEGKSLEKAAKERGEAGPGPMTDAMSDIKEKAESERTKTTSNKLKEVSQTVQATSSPAEVAEAAYFVASAAKMLRYNVKKDVTNYGRNEKLLKAMEEPDGIFTQAQNILRSIESKRPDGSTAESEDTASRQAAILGQARSVAKLAEAIANSYENAIISKEYDDPFRQIVSFEELMTKFLITMDDDRFKPGGEFSILDIDEYTDEFGREMSRETAHPENFLRWVEERAWFYHDFDPMKDINLFEGMYIVTGSRKTSLYEMLVDFNAYFAHRKETNGRLQVLGEDINRAEGNGSYEDIQTSGEYNDVDSTGRIIRRKAPPSGHEEDPEYDPNVIGFYKEFIDPDTIDSKTPKTIKAYVKGSGERKEHSGEELLDVFYMHENKDGKKERRSVSALRENKEKWQTDNSPDTNFEFKNAQTEIMYQLWLMTMNHNYDVSYRQKGMPNEKPLSEALAEIYSDNKFTRTRRRLWAVLDMPATTHREETIEKVMEIVTENGQTRVQPKRDKISGEIVYRAVPAPSEAQTKFRDKQEKLHNKDGSRKQGTMGKAIQRSLAAWYHISEANAAFTGYGGLQSEKDINPFFEVLKNAEGLNGAEIFYSSVVKRMLFEDSKFGYIYPGYEKGANKEQSKVEVELFNALNETEIPRTDAHMEGTSRKRRDWEKADFVDFMTLNRQEFVTKMAGRNITGDSLEKAFAVLRDRYAEKRDGDTVIQAKQARLDEINALEARLNQPTRARRNEFVDNLEKQVQSFPGSETERLKKYADMSKKFKETGSVKDLSGFAVALFIEGFGSEFVKDMNPYSHIRYSLEARDLMRAGMQDALTFTEKLDAFEAKWAEEWAYTFTFHTGISARNDMPGIGHDAWSKILNTEWYRLRQTGGGNYPGNLENLYGIHRLGVNFWEGLVVREDGSSAYNKNLYEELVGLEKVGDGNYKFNINKDLPGFEFAGNAQRQFYADHVMHAVELFIDITQKHEFNLDKIVSQDSMGRVIIHHGEMQKMIDSTWKHMRYGYDNNNFLYDNPVYAWHYDEEINADGKVSRKPKFALMTMRDSMFSHEVQEMDMYNRKDVSSWNGTDKNSEVYHTKMGRNLFAFLIKAQLEEHVKHKERAKLYSADQISLITDAFINYAASVMKGEHGSAVVLSGFFTPDEIRKILVSAHAVLWLLYAKEYGQDALGGFIAAMVQSMQIIMKEVGTSLTLKS